MFEHEDPEIIRNWDLPELSTRQLSPEEEAEVEEARYQRHVKLAKEGKLLWYEVRHRHPSTFGSYTIFRHPDNPITEMEIESIAVDLPGSTEVEVWCFSGESAIRLAEKHELFASMFDESGTVATMTIPIGLPPTNEQLRDQGECLRFTWVKG